jgi:hypothetical protein
MDMVSWTFGEQQTDIGVLQFPGPTMKKLHVRMHIIFLLEVIVAAGLLTAYHLKVSSSSSYLVSAG